MLNLSLDQRMWRRLWCSLESNLKSNRIAWPRLPNRNTSCVGEWGEEVQVVQVPLPASASALRRKFSQYVHVQQQRASSDEIFTACIGNCTRYKNVSRIIHNIYIYIYIGYIYSLFLNQNDNQTKGVIEFLLNAHLERGHTHRFNRTTPRVLSA